MAAPDFWTLVRKKPVMVGAIDCNIPGFLLGYTFIFSRPMASLKESCTGGVKPGKLYMHFTDKTPRPVILQCLLKRSLSIPRNPKMQFSKIIPVSLVVSVLFLSQADGLGLLGGLPLLAGAGILGPLKVAILAKSGFALGVIGTALGGTALGLALKNGNSYDYDYGYGYSSYRKKRSVDGQIDIEDAFDMVFRSDPTHCTERMICDLAAKAKNSPSQLQQDEYAILSVIGGESNEYGVHKAHFEYKGAMKHGLKGSDCQSLYSRCPFTGENLLTFIRIYDQDIQQESTENLMKFIKA